MALPFHNHGAFNIKSSFGTISLSPSPEPDPILPRVSENAPDRNGGAGRACGTGVVLELRTLGGICAAWPPSAVFTVISGDMATMISRVEEVCTESSRVIGGISEEWRRPVAAEECDSGV